MRFAEFVYYWRHHNHKMPMPGFDTETWRQLCRSYRNNTDVSKFFPDEPISFEMRAVTKLDLMIWVDEQLIPYITLKRPNKKHCAYGLKHTAEQEIGRYVCEGELQAALARRGYLVIDYYPISENFFKKRMEV